MRKVVYTCLVGNYDNLKEPEYVMDGWDYICFSNDIISTNINSIWKIKPIPFYTKDKRRLSRFPKLLPHKVLHEYNYSIYIDSNITVLTNRLENRVNDLIIRGVNIAIAKHPERNCIYIEAEKCKETGLDDNIIIDSQLKLYREEGFPTNLGLFENNIIFRNHLDDKILKLHDEWWDIYCKFSKRDQLSLVYLLWKNNINCSKLFDEKFNVRESIDFKYHNHNISYKSKILKKLRIYSNKLAISRLLKL